LKNRIDHSLLQAPTRALLSDDRVQWTGHDIASLFQELGNALEQLTERHDYVAVSFPNSAVQALAILSVLAHERVPVILNLSDLKSRPDAWIERTQASLLLTLEGLETAFEARIPCLALSREGDIVKRPPVRPESKAKASPETALVLFTSGSTGQPKGVLVPKAGLLTTADFLIDYFSLGPATVAPVMLSICHSMALNTQFLPTFLAGGHCHFINPQLEINRLYRNILDLRGDFVSLIGETLLICDEERRRKKLPAADHVRHVQLAGGLINPRHLEIAREVFPNAVIHKGYGLTEAIRVTMIDSRDPNFGSGAVGRPLPFVDVEVRDGGRPVSAPSEIGEIFVRGPNVLRGLLNSASIPVDAQGFLKTGDVGYWNAAGQLCITGRQDGLFKINGHRVSGFEIEKMAIETSNLIRNAKCLAIEETRRAGHRLVLMVEVPADLEAQFLSTGFPAIQADLYRRFRQLPHFPKEIVLLRHFPRTSNGKLAVAELTRLYLESEKTAVAANPDSSLQFLRLHAA